jgi:hypothetical protein
MANTEGNKGKKRRKLGKEMFNLRQQLCSSQQSWKMKMITRSARLRLIFLSLSSIFLFSWIFNSYENEITAISSNNITYTELDLAMQSTCGSAATGNISLSYLLQDFMLARIPAAYYLLHEKGVDKKPRFSTPECRLYALVNNQPKVGLGHRLANFLQAALVSETFELEQVVENLDASGTYHYGY